MELSYDKYERRFWLSLDVLLWLDRLFHPYYEVESLYPTALMALLRELAELPKSNGAVYTRTRYTAASKLNLPPLPLPVPVLPTDQE